MLFLANKADRFVSFSFLVAPLFCSLWGVSRVQKQLSSNLGHTSPAHMALAEHSERGKPNLSYPPRDLKIFCTFLYHFYRFNQCVLLQQPASMSLLSNHFTDLQLPECNTDGCIFLQALRTSLGVL